jgi:hypothetical protein
MLDMVIVYPWLYSIYLDEFLYQADGILVTRGFGTWYPPLPWFMSHGYGEGWMVLEEISPLYILVHETL